MEHTFEFIAKIKDGRLVHMHYKGKSSRHSKVTRQIYNDLQSVYQIADFMVEELYLKPVKNKKI